MNKIQKFASRLIFGSTWDEIATAFLRGDELPTRGDDIVVTNETAMKYSAVFGCVRVLSETLAGVPITLYRKTENGREKVTDESLYDILHNKPNSEMTPFSFKEACMVSLNTGGNAVCEKLFNKKGELVGLYPYPWKMVEIKRNEAGELIYIIKGDKEERILSRDQVFHVPGLSYDGIKGVSPIEYAMSGIKLGLSYEEFGKKFYKNGANNSGIFSFPNALGDTAYERLKKDITKNYTGLANTGKPILLEDGGSFTPIQVKPIDAQLLESKKFQIEDICRIYRVPLHLVQNLDRATFSNIEHLSLEFVMYTMLPWFKRWEEAINMQLLTRNQRINGYYVEFKVDSLLRGDQKSRAESYAAGRQWGWLSVNDIRRLENLKPIPNGDRYLEPENMKEAGEDKQDVKALTEKMLKLIREGDRDA